MPTTYQRLGGSGEEQRRRARRRIAGERARATRRTQPHPAAPATPQRGRPGRTRPAGPEPAGPEPAGPEPRVERPAKGPADPPGRWLLMLAAVLVAAVVVEGVLLVRALQARADHEQRQEALHSAVTEAPGRAAEAAEALLSYSHRDFDAAIERATPFLTATYAKDYTETMNTVVRDAAAQQKATVTAEALSTAVVDASPERTEVLVFVDQTTESAAREEPATALNRAVLTLVRRDGAWVVSDLEGF